MSANQTDRNLKLVAARLLVRQAMRDELRADSEAWRCAERAVAALERAERALGNGPGTTTYEGDVA